MPYILIHVFYSEFCFQAIYVATYTWNKIPKNQNNIYARVHHMFYLVFYRSNQNGLHQMVAHVRVEDQHPNGLTKW